MSSIILYILIVVIVVLLFLLYRFEINKNKLVMELLQEFKENEIELVRSSIMREADVLLEKWKVAHETRIRQDAVSKSKSVITGKVTEHLIPFFPDFPFNPKETRFIGSPIDLIVFKGIDEEDKPVEIYIIEIKTGNASLNKRQRRIREAVAEGKIYWREINILEGDICLTHR